MANTQRFHFGESFDGLLTDEDAGTRTARESRPAPGPTFTESQLRAAEARAFAKGHTAGLTEGTDTAKSEFETSAEHTLAMAMRELGQCLNPTARDQSNMAHRFEQDIVEVATAIARKMTMHSRCDDALAGIESLIREVLPQHFDEPRIVIRANGDLLDGLKPHLDAVKDECGFTGQFILVPASDLEGADCRVEWADGGVDVSSARMWAEIDTAVSEFRDTLNHTLAPGLGASDEPKVSPAPLSQGDPTG